MKRLLTVILFFVALYFSSQAQQVLKVGDTLTTIVLKNTKGDVYDLNNQKVKGFIIVFMTPSCDHCLAYLERVMALHKKYSTKGYPVVAIGPYGDNEKDYPFDALPAMKKLAEEKSFAFPYLADEHFKYTWLFDIRQTPKAVVLQKLKKDYRIKYIGNIDDEPSGKKEPKNKYVEEVVNSLVN